MSILETGHEMPNSVPTVDSLVIDGASLVYSKQPGQSRTFDDYANDIILPHIKSLAQSHLRVDVVSEISDFHVRKILVNHIAYSDRK
jgi:hypothetical protein